MELSWTESYLIVALRVLKPFFRKHGFHMHEIEYGSKDGDYIVFKESAFRNPMKIEIIYNPGFNVIIHEESGINPLTKPKVRSLVELRKQYESYSQLSDNYEGEEGLKEILEEYLNFFETHFLNKKAIE